jgi:hypothetical protein
MKSNHRSVIALILGMAALSGLACNHAPGESTPEDPALVAEALASRQLAFADTYAAAAENLRASLAELKRIKGKEPTETMDAVIKKIAELDGQSKTMRALAVQTRAQIVQSR